MLPVAQGEHRRQHGLQQRLAGLAVLAAVDRAALLRPAPATAGNDAPSDGVKLMYGQPRSRAAQA